MGHMRWCLGAKARGPPRRKKHPKACASAENLELAHAPDNHAAVDDERPALITLEHQVLNARVKVRHGIFGSKRLITNGGIADVQVICSPGNSPPRVHTRHYCARPCPG